MSRRVDSLSVEVQELSAQLAETRTTTNLLDLQRLIEGVAYLTPSDEGYSILSMDLGSLTVSLSDVKPYANGSRVILVFGNPMSARINGLHMTLEWGSVDRAGKTQNEGARHREVTLVESIRPGAWTRVPLVLEGVPPESLGFVRIRDARHTGIGLDR